MREVAVIIGYFLPRCMKCRCGLAMKILSVRPSVCPSVTRVIPDKMEERSVQIFIPYERTFILVFWEEEWLVRATPSTWNFGSTDPRWNENADFQPIIARSSSAVTPTEKSSINANRKSTKRFPMSLRWSSYVAPKSPKGGLKNAKRRFSLKNALRLKKVCYKVSLCENCQRHSCKAFIGLTNRAKIIGGVRPLVPKILDQSDRVGVKSPIFDIFSLVAPQP